MARLVRKNDNYKVQVLNKNKYKKEDSLREKLDEKDGISLYYLVNDDNKFISSYVPPLLRFIEYNIPRYVNKMQTIYLSLINKYREKGKAYDKRYDLHNNFHMNYETTQNEYYLFNNGLIHSWCKIKGFVSDIKYHKDKYGNETNKLEAILITFPFVYAKKNYINEMVENKIVDKNLAFNEGYYLKDSHLWLSIDNIVSYEDNKINKRDVKIAIGMQLTFVGTVEKYEGKNGCIRRGIKEWSPIDSTIEIYLEDKKKYRFIPNNFITKGIIMKYSQDVLSNIKTEITNKFKIKTDIQDFMSSPSYKVIIRYNYVNKVRKSDGRSIAGDLFLNEYLYGQFK